MLKILRLIRIRTLIFTVFVMCMVRYFVMEPLLLKESFFLQMPVVVFVLLIISVCCLVAAAYVINDYFDTRTDRISGVKAVIVGRHITRRTAIILHTILNIVAVGLAFYVSWMVGKWKISLLFFLISGILWFYSSCYKRYLLLGNLMVAFLVGLIPLSVLVFEIPLLQEAYGQTAFFPDFMYLYKWVLGFSFFLVGNTFVYEVNKDNYTMSGDIEKGIVTIPLKWGRRTARCIMETVIVIIMLAVFFLCLKIFPFSVLSWTYIFLAIELPYLFYLYTILNPRGKRSTQLGTIRFIMVAGIAFAFFIGHLL